MKGAISLNVLFAFIPLYKPPEQMLLSLFVTKRALVSQFSRLSGVYLIWYNERKSFSP